MTFSNPIALWGLTGLLIPVAIHLLSRKEGPVVRIGSLRHLTESDSRQFKSIRPNELLLLALRSLIIIWLVLLLGGAQFDNDRSGNMRWIVIENGLETSPQWQSLRDSLVTNGFEEHVLADGFPLRRDFTNSVNVNYWSLLEDLDHRDLDKIVVIASGRINSFRGKQYPLPESIIWINNSPGDTTFTVFAQRVNGDSVVARVARSSSTETSFLTVSKSPNEVSADLIVPVDTIRIALLAEKDFNYDAKIVHAALKAIDAMVPDKIIVTQVPESHHPADWRIQLSKQIDTSDTLSNNIVIQIMPSEQLFIQTGGRQWALTTRLNEGIALEKNFTLQLARLIFPGTKEKQNTARIDRRVLDDQIIHASLAADTTTKRGGMNASSDSLWVILLIVTWLAERWISYVRNQ